MKKCIKCKKTLDIEKFHKRKRKSKYTGKFTVYYDSICKQCNKIQCKERRQTLNGMYCDIYSGQLNSSKTRKHTPPNYTKEKLIIWIEKQPNFKILYDAWAASKYNKWLKPSCDRLDNAKNYTLSNLRLVSFRENFDTYRRDQINGKETSTCKAVNQYDLDGTFIATFHSISEAARCTNSTDTNIGRCCKGRYITSKGYIWRYV